MRTNIYVIWLRIVKTIFSIFNHLTKLARCYITASWTKPNAKVGWNLSSEIWRILKHVWKLVIKLPKTILVVSCSWSSYIINSIFFTIVVVPSIINNVGIKRWKSILWASSFNLFERCHYVFFRDFKHPVVPTVVLLSEWWWNRNIGYVWEKVISNNFDSTITCCSNNCTPSDICTLIVFGQIFDLLATVITNSS